MTEKALKMAENLKKTVETYRKNKTQVPKADLEGRYKSAFEALINRMQAEAEELLNEITVSGFEVLKRDGGPLIEALQESHKLNNIGDRTGRAIYQHYSVDEFIKIAKEQRDRNERLYKIYKDSHVCLFFPESDKGLSDPVIYNNLTKEIYEGGTWKKSEGITKNGGLIMYVRNKEAVL